MLQRGERVADACRRLLRPCLRFDCKLVGTLATGDDGAPLAVTAVEGEDSVATLQPQHVAEIVGLIGVERNRGRGRQRCIDVKARRSEIIAGHRDVASLGRVNAGIIGLLTGSAHRKILW
jgi:hypothetical protein